MCEYAPLLEYRRTEFTGNCNIYNTVAPAFLIISDNVFFSYMRMRQKGQLYGNIDRTMCDCCVLIDHHGDVKTGFQNNIVMVVVLSLLKTSQHIGGNQQMGG